MSLTVKLLPAYGQFSGRGFSNDVLSVAVQGSLIHTLRDVVKGQGLPAEYPNDFTSFVGSCDEIEEYCYGPTIEDKYGDTIRWMPVSMVIPIFEDFQLTENLDWKNRAILYFLKQLPPSLPIYFYFD